MKGFERLEVMLGRAGGYRREGSALVVKCPRCGSDKLHFRIGQIDQQVRQRLKAEQLYAFRFSCFSGACAGWGGRPEFALAELLGISVGAARQELTGDGGLVVYSRREDPFQERPELLEPAQAPTVEWPHQFIPLGQPGSEPGTAYMESRGVPVEIAQQYGVRYSVIDRSVAFPVEVQGRLLGWQLRLAIPHVWVGEDGTKHTSNKATTSPGLQRAQWMFGDRCLGSRLAFALEGPLDAIKAHLVGGNLASMGKVITTSLLRALAAYPWEELCIGLDAGTRAESDKLLYEFDQVIKYPGRRCTWVEWPKKSGEQMDSGALSFQEVRERWDGRKPVRAGMTFFT